MNNTNSITRKAPPAEIYTDMTEVYPPELPTIITPHALDSPTQQLVDTLKAQLAAVSDQRDMLNTKSVGLVTFATELHGSIAEC